MKLKLNKGDNNIFDYVLDEKYQWCYIILVFVAMGIGKSLGYNTIITVLSSITVVLIVGLIFQILKRNKNIKNLFVYLLGSIFGAFSTYLMYLFNKYNNQHNIYMCVKIIQMFLSVLALLFDIGGIIFVLKSPSNREKKVGMIISMIGLSLIAILALVFLPPKGY